MQCPACDNEMFVVEFEMVEIDYCPACRGVWLDSGELGLIGEKAGAVRGELLAALEKAGGKSPTPVERRSCPVCRKTMQHTSTGGVKPIVLDVCPRRHGVWFDHGELSAVVAAAGAAEDNALVRFFGRLGTSSEEKGTTG